MVERRGRIKRGGKEEEDGLRIRVAVLSWRREGEEGGRRGGGGRSELEER